MLQVPEDPATLLAEVLASLNATELARKRFREIARIAGLVFQNHPGEQRSSRQLQASSSLFFEVFRKYDPDNQLLAQADQELLSQELDVPRLAQVLARMQTQRLALIALDKPTPLAFPLLAERFREKLSNESLQERIARMVVELEGAAGGEAVGTAREAAAQAFQRSTVEDDVRASQVLEQTATPKPAPRERRRRRAVAR